MKKVLVYPCGTEMALEVYRAVYGSTHFSLYGGSCSYDHGRFVYEHHIDNLPFIRDNSSKEDVSTFIKHIEKYNFDFIYPATDSVIYKFAQYKELFKETIITPDFFTASISRSKKATYKLLNNYINIPIIYNNTNIRNFPVFIKPDIGQGASGTHIVNSQKELNFYLKQSDKEMLILEYLPGPEYTVDCFTNSKGVLIFSQARKRGRIKSGISVNTYNVENNYDFEKIAKIINSKLNQKGAWFFQLKERSNGELVLLEVAARIAGSSEIARANGVNLPMMTLHLYNGDNISSVLNNNLNIELDRALTNIYKLDLNYNKVYIDYDDTIIINNKINTQIIKFLYQCLNDNCDIILLTKHDGDIYESLKKFKLANIFNKIIHLEKLCNKYEYIEKENAIFIDDSYIERELVKKHLNIPVFSPQELECLIERSK